MTKENKLKFIDLFAGIGGFRLALEKQGCECVFSSEWDPYAAKTYEANFGHLPAGDITKIEASEIPDHDILTAGFPCQPFSIAGVSKHNALGTKHGFKHPTQGTLFFDVVRIISQKKPKVFILENVKNLKSHDKGRTFEVILRTLQDELNYHIYYKIIDARNFVPQHRERIFIVGFKNDLDFKFPELPNKNLKVADILDKKVDEKYTLTPNLWLYLKKYAEKHKKLGNGFGFGIVDLKGVSRTLSARYYKDGSEILIAQAGKNPRRLTPRECARLMGYPDSFKIVCSDTRAYKQFGNSVVVPVVDYVAKEILECLKRNQKATETSSSEIYFQQRLLEKHAKYSVGGARKTTKITLGAMKR